MHARTHVRIPSLPLTTPLPSPFPTCRCHLCSFFLDTPETGIRPWSSPHVATLLGQKRVWWNWHGGSPKYRVDAHNAT